jgi:hypothetical protein
MRHFLALRAADAIPLLAGGVAVTARARRLVARAGRA